MPTYEQLYPTFDADHFAIHTAIPGGSAGHGIVLQTEASRLAVTNKGTNCPCCGQHVQVYRRSIYQNMAKCLLWLVREYKRSDGDWVRLKDGPIFRGGDNTKLKYWHLILDHEDLEGYYKPTEVAVQFVKRSLKLPKYAYVYNGAVQGFSEEQVYIEECLDSDFDLRDIGIPGEWRDAF